MIAANAVKQKETGTVAAIVVVAVRLEEKRSYCSRIELEVVVVAGAMRLRCAYVAVRDRSDQTASLAIRGMSTI